MSKHSILFPKNYGFYPYFYGVHYSISPEDTAYLLGSIGPPSIVMAISPIYGILLITFGTLAGRHLFFASMGRKILGRFAPPSYREKIVCPPGAAKQTPKKS